MRSKDIRWLVFCSFIMSLALMLVGLSFDLIFQVNYRPKMAEWQRDKMANLPSYLSDRDFFAGHAFFGHRPPMANDFSGYLSSRVVAEKPFVVVPLPLQQEVLALAEGWLERRYRTETPPEVIELFQRALAYDHWHIEKSLAMNANLNGSEFVIAGQLLLAHAIDSKDDIRHEVLAKVRHFARLLMTCENLNFKLASLSLLNKERQYTQFLNLRMPAKAVAWDHISERDITRFRDFLFHTYDYLNFLVGAEILEKVFLSGPPPVGFCSVFKLRQPILARAAQLLARQFPFEPTYRSEYADYEKIKLLAANHCAHIEPVKTPPEFSRFFPFFRRIIALRFLLHNKSLTEGL